MRNAVIGMHSLRHTQATRLMEGGTPVVIAAVSEMNGHVVGDVIVSPALVHLKFASTFTMPMLGKDLDIGGAAATELHAPMPLVACRH